MNLHRVPQPVGKLGILLPGLGAVATTVVAGTLLARRGLGSPIGSLTQLGTLRVGAGAHERAAFLRDVVPLASLSDLVFGAWDIFPDNALEAARVAGVLEERHLTPIADELASLKPMPGAFYPEYVRRLNGTHVKKAATKAEMVEQLRDDIRTFKRNQGASRLVAVWCGSTEILIEPTASHQTIAQFNSALFRNDPTITSSQLYAWACLQEGVPFVNGSPNFAADFPAAGSLARETGVPVAGKDYKTGQTLMKTIIGPGLKARLLGLNGWFSTNILGNRDGEVLDDPDSFRAKERSKLGVLEQVLEPERYPELYGKFHHKVRIEYYPPRGDAKEGWDNIDLFGWLGYPMQLKIDFLCRDSILAAPLVLDLALFMDLAQRAGLSGTQDWLSFYFKSPMTQPGAAPVHDLFAQLGRLETALHAFTREGAPEPGEALG
ncbi:MAG TPA: inositol-3-phosphate synthase [Polyangiaceae bacterium]|jgi:myo-inositol-1-phosphate synthase|nr:inositol-3-phosphate synthase [Polyangiaceae bacterium]